ncbi:MAG: hypothetical protein IJV22_07380 [Bacteroidales bacterium]|nr:hypothetical protein [Bacteroidales bacterium]
MYSNYLKRIRTSSNIGLFGTLLAVATVAILHYVLPWKAAPNAYTAMWLLSISSALAVADVMLTLHIIRRRIPHIRQAAELEFKLREYARCVATIYWMNLMVALVECAIVLLLNEMALLMILLLMVVMLFMAFPNMYKIKIDLGLDDVQMRLLFGERYVDEGASEVSEAVIVDSENGNGDGTAF